MVNSFIFGDRNTIICIKQFIRLHHCLILRVSSLVKVKLKHKNMFAKPCKGVRESARACKHAHRQLRNIVGTEEGRKKRRKEKWGSEKFACRQLKIFSDPALHGFYFNFTFTPWVQLLRPQTVFRLSRIGRICLPAGT